MLASRSINCHGKFVVQIKWCFQNLLFTSLRFLTLIGIVLNLSTCNLSMPDLKLFRSSIIQLCVIYRNLILD